MEKFYFFETKGWHETTHADDLALRHLSLMGYPTDKYELECLGATPGGDATWVLYIEGREAADVNARAMCE